jgi:hypothetical protein
LPLGVAGGKSRYSSRPKLRIADCQDDKKGDEMKKTMALLLLAVPAVACADYVDVLSAKLKEGCSVATLQLIVKDFNETWAKEGTYKAELLVPMMSQDVNTVYWVGRTKDAETFGKGLERWRREAMDANSVAGKLSARMSQCVNWGSRGGFTTS